VRITRFAGEFAALASWTGVPEQELRDRLDYQADGGEAWLAWDGRQIVGLLDVWHAPDGRVRLFFGQCRPDAYSPLADAVGGPCYVTVDRTDGHLMTYFADAGFAELRQENEYEIPVSIMAAPIPDGIRVVTADQTELEPLMLLDCAIRADIPGSDGWQPDAAWFREQTYDSPDFDPQAYLVALDGEMYVGLVRIWRRSPSQTYRRLGCVGVLAGYRRRGLARALIARAFVPLAAAGETTVTAEADTTNIASHTLLTGFGGKVTGGTAEYFRDG
jgi:ribosomal protein S18 acetylase RimI-like enzyme